MYVLGRKFVSHFHPKLIETLVDILHENCLSPFHSHFFNVLVFERLVRLQWIMFYPTLIAFNFPISSSLGLHKWTLRKLSDWIINLISANLFWRDILQLLNCSQHFSNSSQLNTWRPLYLSVCSLFSEFSRTQSKLFGLVNIFQENANVFKL